MIAIKKSRQGQLWYKEIKKILLSRNIILHGEVSLYIFKKKLLLLLFFIQISRGCVVFYLF